MRLQVYILVMLALLSLVTENVAAQHTPSPVWCFGHNARLEFNSSTPAPGQSSIYTHAAVSATQCDANGNVLFYANGLKIWDANGDAMPGSDNPLWASYTSSWNLNATIVPDASDSNIYYVFTTFPSKGTAPFGSYFVGQLTYSVVDMRLNGGLGDVVPGKNHILLDKDCGHYMTVVPGTGCSYWAVVQSGDLSSAGFAFKAYKIDDKGVHATPVISPFSTVPSLFPNGNGQGVGKRAGNLIYSYTRKKLIAGYESADINAYDFDEATGKVSNPVALTWAFPNTENWVNSVTIPAICLSPDESLLYVSGYYTAGPNEGGFHLRQFPLFMAGQTLFVGNAVTLFASDPANAVYFGVEHQSGVVWQKSDMQLGADKKIYHTFTLGQSFVGCIEQPNVAGLGCNFVPKKILLAPGTYTTSSMPAPSFPRKAVERINVTPEELAVCFQPIARLQAPQGFSSYVWQDGSTAQYFNATTSGTYVVTSSDDACRIQTDSFKVKLTNFDLSLGGDIVTCFDTVLYPVTDAPPTATYTWSNDSTGIALPVNSPGIYRLTVSAEGCERYDEVAVSDEEIILHLPADTALCTGEIIRLDAAITGVSYLWQDGSTEPVYYADKEGVYSVHVTKGRCSTEASVNVAEEYCDHCLSGVPSGFTPNNDGLNDIFRPIIYPICPVKNYRFSVYNRFGERVFTTHDPKEGWDGIYRGMRADLGTYFYQLKFTGPLGKEYYHKGDVVLIR